MSRAIFLNPRTGRRGAQPLAMTRSMSLMNRRPEELIRKPELALTTGDVSLQPVTSNAI